MEEKQNWIIKLLTNWKAIASLLVALMTLAFTARYAFWEYSDKLEARNTAFEEARQKKANEAQAELLHDLLKKDFDQLMSEFKITNDLLVEQSIKKDSILQIVLPKIVGQISRSNRDIGRLDRKFNAVLRQDKGESIDVIRILNVRDSIAAAKNRSDSLDMVLLREIRNINRALRESATKYGDRAE